MLRGLVVLLIALGSRWAAAEALLVPARGDPVAGRDAPVLVVIFQDGAPVDGSAPVVIPERGEITGRTVLVRPGVWRFRYRAPTLAPGKVRFTITQGDRTWVVALPVEPAPATALVVPSRIDAPLRRDRAVSIPVGGQLPADPAELEVAVPEGKVTGVQPSDSGLVVQWVPGPEPFPRAVPIAIRDGSRPAAPPAWTVVRLYARPRVPVQTEPGALVTLRVGGRTYGPVVASQSGAAQVTVEVWPGETVAQVDATATDGSTHSSSIALGGSTRPALTALVEGPILPGWRIPQVYLRAVTVDGAPWPGQPPSCSSALGEPLSVVTDGAGAWRALLPILPGEAVFDVRVDCTVGLPGEQAAASVRVPVSADQPSTLKVRVAPHELSAQTPRAQVIAWLENPESERVPAQGIELGADAGSVVTLPSSDRAALRAEYHGENAVDLGHDTVRASWNAAPGKGPAWDLELYVRWPPHAEQIRLAGRALDRDGGPLTGVPVKLAVNGRQVEATPGPRGWWQSTVRAPSRGPAIVSALSEGVERRTAVFAGERIGRDPNRPDLSASADVRIYTGDVREVFVSTDPRTLVLDGASRARVLVRLVDRSGNPVSGADVQVKASEGRVGEPERQPDGTFEATYTPPPDAQYGTVVITASDPSGTFAASTELELVPRPVHKAPGLRLGYLLGARGLSSLWVDVDTDFRLPFLPRMLMARATLGLYGEHTQFVDDATNSPVDLYLDVLPVGLGLVGRRERGRSAAWIGTSLIAAPYHVEAHFGEEVPVRGMGLAPPGFHLYTGAGWRVRSGELEGQVGYLMLSLNPGEVGWQGPVGGLLASVGYKVMF